MVYELFGPLRWAFLVVDDWFLMQCVCRVSEKAEGEDLGGYAFEGVGENIVRSPPEIGRLLALKMTTLARLSA